jgi:hypothetical protein
MYYILVSTKKFSTCTYPCLNIFYNDIVHTIFSYTKNLQKVIKKIKISMSFLIS